MRCAYDPDVETNLRCGKCDKPICSQCLVQTQVGARCRDCARLYKLPTYRITTIYYFRAIGTALGMAIVCGIVWGVIKWVLPFFYFNLLLAPAVGYAIGGVVGLSVNRKRGTGLAILAGVAVVISYLVTIFFGGLSFHLFNIMYLFIDLLALSLGIFVAVTRLR